MATEIRPKHTGGVGQSHGKVRVCLIHKYYVRMKCKTKVDRYEKQAYGYTLLLIEVNI